MTGAEMVEAMKAAVRNAEADALKSITPIQLAALKASGLALVPEWVATDFIRVLAKVTPTGSTE